jgi:hypothetical protein
MLMNPFPMGMRDSSLSLGITVQIWDIEGRGGDYSILYVYGSMSPTRWSIISPSQLMHMPV